VFSVRYDGASSRGWSLFIGEEVSVFYIIYVTFVTCIYAYL